MRTTTSRHLLVTATAIVAMLCPAWAVASTEGSRGPVVKAAGDLRDLQAAAGPFDGAAATFNLVASASGSHAVLRVRNIGAGANGRTYGAHLHLGPCVAGDAFAALGHYNTDVLAGVIPPEVSEQTEVWLDLTVDDGAATTATSVPFVPVAGARSVVIHAVATDHHTGAAGPRLACLPVVW